MTKLIFLMMFLRPTAGENNDFRPSIQQGHFYDDAAFNPQNSNNDNCGPKPFTVSWENIGNLTWKKCVLEASRRAAMLASQGTGDPSSTNGWQGHRNGDVAAISSWPAYGDYTTKPIHDAAPCVLGRDDRTRRIVPHFTDATSYGGVDWAWRTFPEPMYYDICRDHASDSGGMLITPYTIGQEAQAHDDYWMYSTHSNCQYEWLTKNGTNWQTFVPSDSRGPLKKCMIGRAVVPNAPTCAAAYDHGCMAKQPFSECCNLPCKQAESTSKCIWKWESNCTKCEKKGSFMLSLDDKACVDACTAFNQPGLTSADYCPSGKVYQAAASCAAAKQSLDEVIDDDWCHEGTSKFECSWNFIMNTSEHFHIRGHFDYTAADIANYGVCKDACDKLGQKENKKVNYCNGQMGSLISACPSAKESLTTACAALTNGSLLAPKGGSSFVSGAQVESINDVAGIFSLGLHQQDICEEAYRRNCDTDPKFKDCCSCTHEVTENMTCQWNFHESKAVGREAMSASGHFEFQSEGCFLACDHIRETEMHHDLCACGKPETNGKTFEYADLHCPQAKDSILASIKPNGQWHGKWSICHAECNPSAVELQELTADHKIKVTGFGIATTGAFMIFGSVVALIVAKGFGWTRGASVSSTEIEKSLLSEAKPAEHNKN